MLCVHCKHSVCVHRLTNIKDPSIVDMEGATVEGRMQGLIKQIADDIKRCANVCDVWSKMRVLARILKAPFWEGTFVGFVNTFTQRRTDLVFAMSMHTARGIDHISDKLDSMTQLMEERCAYCRDKTAERLTSIEYQDKASHKLPPNVRPASPEEYV